MSRITLGITVAVLGVVLIVASALADVIGIGGALGTVFGGLMAFRKPTS